MKKLLFLSFCLIWLPLFSSAQIIQGESTTTQTLFVPEKKIPEKGYPRYQGDIYLGYAGDDICLSLTTTHGIRINKYLFAGAGDRKSTRLNSSHNRESRMPSSA